MTFWNNKAFTENELSKFGKLAVTLLFVVPAIVITIHNILVGEVRSPYAFSITIFGLILFIISKASLISRRKWVSFGTKNLTENMANLYRLGYWLMAVGIILTFI